MFTKSGIYIIFLLLLCSTFSLADDVKTLEIGSAAPDFNLLGIDDKYHTLKSKEKREA